MSSQRGGQVTETTIVVENARIVTPEEVVHAAASLIFE
jgi:hypothetical protein